MFSNTLKVNGKICAQVIPFAQKSLERLNQMLLLYSRSCNGMHLAERKSQSLDRGLSTARGWGRSCPDILASRTSAPAIPCAGLFSPRIHRACSLTFRILLGRHLAPPPKLQVPCPPFPLYRSGILHILRVDLITCFSPGRMLSSRRARSFVFLHWDFVEKKMSRLMPDRHSGCLIFG